MSACSLNELEGRASDVGLTAGTGMVPPGTVWASALLKERGLGAVGAVDQPIIGMALDPHTRTSHYRLREEKFRAPARSILLKLNLLGT